MLKPICPSGEKKFCFGRCAAINRLAFRFFPASARREMGGCGQQKLGSLGARLAVVDAGIRTANRVDEQFKCARGGPRLRRAGCEVELGVSGDSPNRLKLWTRR